MTTSFGMETNIGPRAVVLFADARNTLDELTKTVQTKIFISRLKTFPWAIAIAGHFDVYGFKFVSYLNGNTDLSGLIKFLNRDNSDKEIEYDFGITYPLSRKTINKMRAIIEAGTDDSIAVNDPLAVRIRMLASGEIEASDKGLDEFLLEMLKFSGVPGSPKGKLKFNAVVEGLRRRRFYGLSELNRLAVMRDPELAGNELEFILACGFEPYFGLYHVDHYGVARKIPDTRGLPYLCIGSSAKIISGMLDNEEFVDEENPLMPKIDPDKIYVRAIFDLGRLVMERAMKKDGNSGDRTDIVILPEGKEIVDYRGQDMEARSDFEKGLHENRKSSWPTLEDIERTKSGPLEEAHTEEPK